MLVAITTMIPSSKGFVWFPAEVEQTSIDDVFDALLRDGALRVVKLDGSRNPDGSLTVFRRNPQIVGRAMVGTIAPLHMTVVEP